MPEPLSIFNAKFLFYESTEKPTESLAQSILNKTDPQMFTSVIIALYSRGFYVKGFLNHSSYENAKSRSDQFVSSGLLREVYLYPFYKNLLIMTFHETINLITEVLLFSFSANLTEDCNRFFEYLQTLLSTKFCSTEALNSFETPFRNQPLKSSNKDDINSEQTSNLSSNFVPKISTETFISHLDKVDETVSEEILDSSFLSESSSDDVFYEKPLFKTQKQIVYGDQFQRTFENIETFTETTIYRTKKSSLFDDELPNTFDSLDSIQTFCEDNLNSSNSTTMLRNRNENSENISNKSDDCQDSFHSILSNQFDETELKEIYSNDELDSYPLMTKFRNGTQIQSLLNSLNSIEEIEFDSAISLETSNFHQIFIPTDSGFDQFANSIKLEMKFNDDDDLYFEKPKSEYMENKNIFCWPDFLKHESKFTSSMLVEMSFLIQEMNSNWSLVDRWFRKESSDDRKLPIHLKWDERVNRLNYDPKKKNFELDDNGSLVMYCCRQICVEEEEIN